MERGKTTFAFNKYILPKNKDFAIYVERTKLNLSNEDAFILNLVQDEVSKLLIRSGLYGYNPSDNTVWLKRIPVDEDSELKHEILKFLNDTKKNYYRNELSNNMNIEVFKLDYLTENMKEDNAINKKDTSSFQGKYYNIEISDKGVGMLFNDYYLKPNIKTGFSVKVNNDYSNKINVGVNKGVIAQDSDLREIEINQRIDTTPSKKDKIINPKSWYETPLFKYLIWPLLAAILAGLIIYKITKP